jgi:hypothetical protein
VTLSSNHNATFASIYGPWGLVFDTAGDLWFSNEGIILNSAFFGEYRGQLPDGEWHTDARNSVHSIDDQGWRHHRRQGVSIDNLGNLAVSNDANNSIAIFKARQLKGSAR